METVVFIVCAVIVVSGALGVVVARNPVHSALMLVMTLFGVAVLFVNQEAHFLAAVQVIVYAGAIVVLFLFVIMLLGVDRADDLGVEPIAGQRPVAIGLGVAAFVLGVVFIVVATDGATGARGAVEPIDEATSNISQLARVLFTDYVFAFELTGILLTIAVVGAVVLTRRPTGELDPIPDADPVADMPGPDETSDA